ncbi:Two-pore potassium channel 1 [Linum perenne]
MACNDPREPLLSRPADPNPLISAVHAPKRRVLRRVRSAPQADFVPPAPVGKGKDNELISRPDTISGQLHPSLKKVAVCLAIYLGLGTLSFYIVRNDIKGKKTNDLLDALYFCVVTMTTVGYGDLVPSSSATKLLACLFVFSGMALVAFIMSKAADYLVEKQEVLLVKAMHLRDKAGPSEILKEIETNKVKYKCLLTAGILSVLMIIGSMFLYYLEGLGLVDSFYCICSTITTLGYGDKSFSTSGGRLFAVIWIVVSTIGLAQLFLYIAEVFTESRQRALVRWVLTRKMTTVDLEAADFDSDGNAVIHLICSLFAFILWINRCTEFVLYKLKEMGKITQDDIMLVMEEFEGLDVDQSGTISASDLVLAQTTEANK